MSQPISWDDYGLLLAETVSFKSKDPSTKVGAVILDEENLPLSFGFNGFPRGVLDLAFRYEDRPTKYTYVAHAERNAIDLCRVRPKGGTLYINKPFVCKECAKSIIQSGIRRVVVNSKATFGSGKGNTWEAEEAITLQMFHEAGVQFVKRDLLLTVKIQDVD